MARNTNDKTPTATTTGGTDADTTTTAAGAEDGFEFLDAIPASSGGAGGKSKYDWEAFPEPSEGRYPSKVFPVKTPKTLYTSIGKFKKKCEKDGKPVPDFTVRREKDADGKVVSCRVIRTK
jgi:hypothetical protein